MGEKCDHAVHVLVGQHGTQQSGAVPYLRLLLGQRGHKGADGLWVVRCVDEVERDG